MTSQDPNLSITRRDFLRISLGAGATIAIGPILTACAPAPTPAPTAAPPTAAPAATLAPTAVPATAVPTAVPTKPLTADLIIGCWPGYEKFFQDNAFTPFTSKNPGVKITMEIAPASQIYAKLLAAKGSKPPVHGTAMNDAFSWTGIKDGMWQTLTVKELPNLAKVPEKLLSKAGPFWAINAFGITFNPKFLPEGIKSWTDLYSPKLAGKVGMWPAYFDAYIMAAKAAGKDEKNIDAGIEAWKKAKANIGLWIRSVAEIHQAIDKGEIWAAPDWGSTALRDAASGMNLAFTIPEEGAVLNRYYMQSLKGISDNESQAVNGILNLWISEEVQTALFKEQYLIPVVSTVTPDMSKLPANLNFKFTADDAVKKLYSPDYGYVGDNTKQITDMIAQALR